MSNVAIQAAPGMTVQVAVPAGCNPGDTIMVDPDGPAGPQPPIPVTIPAGVSPGQMLSITVPLTEARALPSCDYPGLEYLAIQDKIIVKQKVELFEAFTGFETANAYEMYGEDGNPIYQLAENSACCERMMCGSIRSMEIIVQPVNMGFTCLSFTRPLRCSPNSGWCCYMQEITVEYVNQSGERTPLGGVFQDFTCCAAKFSVRDAGGNALYAIQGPLCVCDAPCCDVEFKIEDMNGEEVGVITKKKIEGLAGYAAQLFTDADNFSADFPDDAPVEHKAVIMAGVMLIDFCFFEKSAADDGGGFSLDF